MRFDTVGGTRRTEEPLVNRVCFYLGRGSSAAFALLYVTAALARTPEVEACESAAGEKFDECLDDASARHDACLDANPFPKNIQACRGDEDIDACDSDWKAGKARCKALDQPAVAPQQSADVCTIISQRCTNQYGWQSTECSRMIVSEAKRGNDCTKVWGTSKNPQASGNASAGKTTTNSGGFRPLGPTANSGEANDAGTPGGVPARPDGRACISVSAIEPTLTTSSEQHCPVRNEFGNCRDRILRVQVINGCRSSVNFRWRFPSREQSMNLRTLQGGASTIVSCQESLQNCDGQIEYTSAYP